MNIIVSQVNDITTFKHFICIKYTYPSSYAQIIINSINTHGAIKFYNLLECEIRYLIYKKVCKFKITNDMPLKRKRPSIPPYCDNERKSCIDISPQPNDEPKQEPLDLFHVKFTKVIHFDEMLNERQIQALLKDNHVKSINIEK